MMNDMNRTFEWLAENAPKAVTDDFRNLLLMIAKQSEMSRKSLHLLSTVEVNADTPEKLREMLKENNLDIVKICDELEKINGQVHVDADILALLDKASDNFPDSL